MENFITDSQFFIWVNGLMYCGEWSASVKETYYQAATYLQPAEGEVSIDLDINYLEVSEDEHMETSRGISKVLKEINKAVEENLLDFVNDNLHDYLED